LLQTRGQECPRHWLHLIDGVIRIEINQHTLEKICKLEPVRAIKLAKCLKTLEEYEGEKGTSIKS